MQQTSVTDPLDGVEYSEDYNIHACMYTWKQSIYKLQLTLMQCCLRLLIPIIWTIVLLPDLNKRQLLD